MFLEVIVDLHALVHGLNIVGEHGSVVFVGLVDSLIGPLEVLLHALSVAIPLPPHLQLRLEVGKSLLDQFDVEESSHTVRGFHEGVELVLKATDFQKDVTWASRAVSRRNVDFEATLLLLSILLPFQPVDIDAWVQSLVSARWAYVLTIASGGASATTSLIGDVGVHELLQGLGLGFFGESVEDFIAVFVTNLA